MGSIHKTVHIDDSTNSSRKFVSRKKILWTKSSKLLNLLSSLPRILSALSKDAQSRIKKNSKRLLLQPLSASLSWVSLDSSSNSSTFLSIILLLDHKFYLFTYVLHIPLIMILILYTTSL